MYLQLSMYVYVYAHVDAYVYVYVRVYVNVDAFVCCAEGARCARWLPESAVGIGCAAVQGGALRRVMPGEDMEM